MEARARGEGTDVGGLYGNPFSSHAARNQQLAEAMRARASAQANGAARLAASPFSPHPHRPQQYPMGALMGRMAGQEDEGVGRGVWLQQSGGPGMRVLRVASGPGSFRALSMPVGATADGDDDSDFPPFGHPPMGITMSMGGRGSSGMRLMSTRIPNDSDSDGGDGSSDGEGDGRNHGASGSLPSYRVINNPQHRGLGGALAQSHSLPARMIISGRNVESSVSTATVPTRTTYILRTVHGGGAPEGQGSRGYEAHPMRWSSGGGDNTEDRN
ncbi:unnamed protein product [Symbiodinium microadriaticum]|nr:unnamed protein product [Symbiodinium microadriaticum]